METTAFGYSAKSVSCVLGIPVGLHAQIRSNYPAVDCDPGNRSTFSQQMKVRPRRGSRKMPASAKPT